MELYLVVFLSLGVFLIFPACWHSGTTDKIQHMCKRNRQVGLYSASWSGPERKDTIVCPTPSTWRRPNHEEPGRSDTFRSGNGKCLWQLWLLFTRMSGLTLPSSAHLAVHLADLVFFLKILAKATCALGSFCTSGISHVSSAPLAFYASCLTCKLPNLQLSFTATTQR